MPATQPAANLSESVVHLGADRGVLGIVTPAPGDAAARPGVVLLNAGVLHRVGPHRLHVILARRLAARGLTALRVDLAGIGDSPGRGDGSFWASAVVDAQAAMTALEATGCQRFVLFGLCSGADNAVATAAVDPRVCGIVLVDPPTYATRRSQARKLVARVATGGLGAITHAVQRRLARAAAPAADAPVYAQGRELPTREAHGAQLTALVDRGVAILAIYSGTHADRYNHADQLFEWFPALRGRVDVAYFPDANHVFTVREQQAALGDRVVAWVERTFR